MSKLLHHFTNEVTRDLGLITALGKVESEGKTFTGPKDYLEHKLNDPKSSSHLQDTEHHNHLKQIYKNEHNASLEEQRRQSEIQCHIDDYNNEMNQGRQNIHEQNNTKSRTQTQKTIEKTKDDDFTFNM